VVAAELQEVKTTLADLASRLAAVSELVTEHGEQLDGVAELSEMVQGLADVVTGGAAGADGQTGGSMKERPRTWCWTSIGDDAEASAKMAELTWWVTEVLTVEYSDYTRKIMLPCWNRHRAVVWELTVLYNEWQTSFLYDKRGTRDACDWHDRWLPGVLHRLGPVFKECQGHDDEADQQQRMDGPQDTPPPTTRRPAARPSWPSPGEVDAVALVQRGEILVAARELLAVAYRTGQWSDSQYDQARDMIQNQQIPVELRKLLHASWTSFQGGSDVEQIRQQIREHVPGLD
jgi:hypothetical protein